MTILYKKLHFAGKRSCGSLVPLQHNGIFRFFSHHNQVVCGDCTQPKTYGQLYKTIPSSGKADILITDPPYCLLIRKRINGEKRDSKQAHNKRNKIDEAIEVPRYQNLADYREFSEKWIRTALKHGLKQDAPLIIWSNLLGKSIIIDVCKQLDYQFVGEYVWAKLSSSTTDVASSSKNEILLRVYEVALIFQSKYLIDSADPPLLPHNVLIRKDIFKHRHSIPWSVVTGYHDIIDGSSIPHKHPCHKPLDCLQPLLSSWSRPNDVILDPFAGSGGIARAVINVGENRQYRGIEILETWSRETSNIFSL